MKHKLYAIFFILSGAHEVTNPIRKCGTCRAALYVFVFSPPKSVLGNVVQEMSSRDITKKKGKIFPQVGISA